MGNDFESPQSLTLWENDEFAYKPKKAKTILALIEDLEKLNKVSKTQLSCRNCYYIFELDNAPFLKKLVKLDNWPSWKDDIRIQVLHISNAPVYTATFKKFITYNMFYKLFTRMQTEASIHCMNQRLSKQHLSGLTPLDSQQQQQQPDFIPLDSECIICMDNKAEIMLECNHSFCEKCITQWNLSSQTCPYCRRATSASDESSWNLVDAPLSQEEVAQSIHNFIESAIMNNKSNSSSGNNSSNNNNYNLLNISSGAIQSGTFTIGANSFKSAFITTSVTFPRAFEISGSESEIIVVVTPHAADFESFSSSAMSSSAAASINEIQEGFSMTVSSVTKSGFKCTVKKVARGMQQKGWNQQLKLDWIARIRDDVECGKSIIGTNESNDAAEIKITIPVAAGIKQMLLPCVLVTPVSSSVPSNENINLSDTFAAVIDELHADKFTVRIRRVSFQYKHDWGQYLQLNWTIFYPVTKFPRPVALDILTYQIPDNDNESAQFLVKFVKPLPSIPNVVASVVAPDIVCPVVTIQKVQKEGFTAVLQRTSPDQRIIGSIQLNYVAMCPK